MKAMQAGLVAATALVLTHCGKVEHEVDQEIQTLAQDARERSVPKITEEGLARYPAPVQRMLRRSGVVEREGPRFLRIKETGQIWLQQGKPPLDFVAEQYVAANPNGFVWHALPRGLPLDVKDSFVSGVGSLVVEMAPAVEVQRAEGHDADVGEFLRFVAEMPLMPSAFLRDNVTFQPVDDHHVHMSVATRGTVVSGILTINDDGENTDFITTERPYKDEDGNRVQVPWWGHWTAYQDVDGLHVPSVGEVSWRLKDGDFTYCKLTFDVMEYDRFERFSREELLKPW